MPLSATKWRVANTKRSPGEAAKRSEEASLRRRVFTKTFLLGLVTRSCVVRSRSFRGTNTAPHTSGLRESGAIDRILVIFVMVCDLRYNERAKINIGSDIKGALWTTKHYFEAEYPSFDQINIHHHHHHATLQHCLHASRIERRQCCCE